MSADGGGMRSTTRIAALLVAMAPVVTGIYQEAREGQTRRADARASRETALQEQRAADELADSKVAKELSTALLTLDDGGARQDRAFCNQIHLAISRLDTEARSPRTSSLIRAALLIRNDDDPRLRICGCSNAGGVGGSWLTGYGADGGRAEVEKRNPQLMEALTNAAADCEARTCANATAATGRLCTGNEAGSPTCLVAQAEQAKLCTGDPASAAALRAQQLERQLADLRTQLEQARAEVAKCPAAGQCPGDGLNTRPPVVGTPLPPRETGATPRLCTIAPPLGATRRRVFIQVPDAVNRSLAERFRTAINAQPPFKSPGIEVVGDGRSPEVLQVRYAYAEDLDSAQKLKAALDSGACGYKAGDLKAELYPMPQLQGRTDRGVLEVWWPRN